MKPTIAAFSRLADIRASQVKQLLGRVHYQQRLCQRYQDNIAALSRLCGFGASIDTALQRHNHQQYKATLHRMINLQTRELVLAEQTLERLRRQMLQAMCGEKAVMRALAGKVQEWQMRLARQEQKLQDGLGAQAWWQARLKNISASI